MHHEWGFACQKFFFFADDSIVTLLFPFQTLTFLRPPRKEKKNSDPSSHKQQKKKKELRHLYHHKKIIPQHRPRVRNNSIWERKTRNNLELSPRVKIRRSINFEQLSKVHSPEIMTGPRRFNKGSTCWIFFGKGQ